MFFYPEQKTAIFIDGITVNGNMKGALSSSGQRKKIDYRGLLDFFRKESTLVTARFYTITDNGTEHNPVRKLIDFLAFNGYIVNEKPTKEHELEDGRVSSRGYGRVDVEMVTDMMALAERVDHMVIYAARSDFAHTVRALQAKGVRVTVMGMDKMMVSEELRRQADDFMSIEDIPGILNNVENSSTDGNM